MEALVIIVNKVEYTRNIVGIMKDSGIRGATIIDGIGSNGSNKKLLNTNSFLASIVEGLDQRNEAKKIILSVVEKETHVTKAIEAITHFLEVENKVSNGVFIFTLPINYMRGGELERHIIRRDGKMD